MSTRKKFDDLPARHRLRILRRVITRHSVAGAHGMMSLVVDLRMRETALSREAAVEHLWQVTGGEG